MLLIITIASSLYLWIIGRNRTLLLFLAAVGGAALLTLLTKFLFDRPRPDYMSALTLETSGSFPSGHALLSTVVYLTVGVLLGGTTDQKRLKIYFILVALVLTGMVGFSRVYLGVHYPTDILAGFSGGLVWAVLCWAIACHLQKQGSIKEAAEDDRPANTRR